uniref:Uncharacterized protein n=1 Tax=viral metagenome TaxID=1070528 RepID=A0A6C0EY57_9ZZZZ
MSELDATDYIYVSNKNFQRRKRVETGNDQLGNLVATPGPISEFILAIFDVVVTLFLKLVFKLFTISSYAFSWVNNIIFGAFEGIIPSALKRGKVISMKFFRYTMTILMPPFGVMLGKGLYGWFNIFVCMLITYVNFLAGIIYAFVITARNRYADQYEAKQIEVSLIDNPIDEASADINALLSSFGFIFTLLIVIFYSISYF